MKISLEFTEDDLETLRCMVYDSRTMHQREHDNCPATYFCADIIQDHERMIEFIETAQSKLAARFQH